VTARAWCEIVEAGTPPEKPGAFCLKLETPLFKLAL
jgi:hypothetical protein